MSQHHLVDPGYHGYPGTPSPDDTLGMWHVLSRAWKSSSAFFLNEANSAILCLMMKSHITF